MDNRRPKITKNFVVKRLIIGSLIGASFGYFEYAIRLKLNDDIQALIPLLLRSIAAGSTIYLSIMIFEVLLSDHFKQKRFMYLVISRSLGYTFLLSFWLFVENIVWFLLNKGPFWDQLNSYAAGETYLINLISSMLVVFVGVGLFQIDKLHRRGELFKYIIGQYHAPKEVDGIFCFIDLKNSTTIAEKLGHVRFASFLKDYYSDITEALRETKAQIYQYVGDEIILSWSFDNGLKHNRLIRCFFIMRSLIQNKKEDYLKKYGYYPEFKAGLHGGTVTVTWVGEIKKEIVFIGDVLNTTARICENCTRLQKDFLISGFLLKNISDPYPIQASFVETLVPRGKERGVDLYSLELMETKQA